MSDTIAQAAELLDLLKEKRRTVATAESCTGGGLAAALTAVAGSSACFGYGVITYSNEAKQTLLKVPADGLERFGAVSPQVACAMAQGLQELSGADLNVSVTGVAGPDGGTEAKPVGLVFVGLAVGPSVVAFRFQFTGDRESIRRQTVDKVLLLLIEAVKGDTFFNENEE